LKALEAIIIEFSNQLGVLMRLNLSAYPQAMASNIIHVLSIFKGILKENPGNIIGKRFSNERDVQYQVLYCLDF